MHEAGEGGPGQCQLFPVAAFWPALFGHLTVGLHCWSACVFT